MIQLEIPETNRLLSLPEELAECNSRQYAEACNLIFLYQTDQLSLKDFRVQMIYKLLDLKKGTRKKITENEENEMYSNIAQLSVFIDSFFYEKEEGKELAIKLHYIHNHTPSVKYFVPILYGPADEFENVTFGQYVDALNVYYMMQTSPSKEMMYDLMAIFYLPKGKKYSPKLTDKYVKHLQKIHFGKVYGFYLLFASFQTYLFSAAIFYQGQELDLSILFKDDDNQENQKKKPESEIPGIGMKSIEFQLAESGVFGPLEKVRETNFWEIILRLYDIRKRDLDHETERKREEAKAKAKQK